MCGILGGVFRRPVTAGDVAAFRAAIGTLEHRGPDAEGIHVVEEANAVLAFRRLAIIDLATGDQPMSNGNGQHIVFNGEIYNYREVRQELAGEGAQFRTASDTEVLLQALARTGIAGLEPLRGMFGFGFLDVARGVLQIGRDRLGVKQVYYAEGPTGFFFASEPKALLALPWIHAEFAIEQLPAYLTFRCVPAPATLLRGIAKLPAAHVLTYDFRTHRSRVDRYWELPSETEASAEHVPAGEALDRFEATFLQAVRRRLIADVPVGAFLSGGLDSSMVVAAMRRLGHAEVRTFSATFPGSRDNEAQFARRVAARFGAAHHESAAMPDEFVSALPGWVELNDDLVADASCLPLLGVSRLARRSGCIVMLSGEGADELFSGYGSYHKFALLRRLAALVPSARTRGAIEAAAAAVGLVSEQDRPRVREYFVRRGGYLGTAALLGEADLTDLLTDPIAADGSLLPRAVGTRLADLGAFDFSRRIPDDLLVRTDRATMGASIEARVPFLDQDLVELSSRLPAATRAIPGISKVILRRLAYRWGVPYQTIIHRKIGFQLPIGLWFRGPLRGLWTMVLEERAVPGIRYPFVARLVDAHQRGAAQFDELLWRVAALELWYRRWVGGVETGSLLPSRNQAGVEVAAG